MPFNTVHFTDPVDLSSIVIPSYTSTVKHLVKAGEAISKGQAVYVTGSTGNAGTNMIVGKASNAQESTSSKTCSIWLVMFFIVKIEELKSGVMIFICSASAKVGTLIEELSASVFSNFI